MQVRQLVLGELGTNCYLVVCERTGKAAVIDPGGEPGAVLQAAGEAQATIEQIVATHGHLDHVLGVPALQAATGARTLIHQLDLPLLRSDPTGLADWLNVSFPLFEPDGFIAEGDEVQVGDLRFQVLHTPGHTPGHVTLLTEGVAFVGDVLFAQGIGRTDFPGGNQQQLMDSIRNRLLTLDDATVVYSGHGPATTIGAERRSNPWL